MRTLWRRGTLMTDMIETIDLSTVSMASLRDMKDAADEVKECQRVLAKTGDTILTELLRHEGDFLPWRHYPFGDVFDPEFHAQYYFHGHEPSDLLPGEHGHFHTFVRRLGLPDEAKPAPLPDYRPADDPNDEVCHIVAISIDARGEAFRLFTTNRWVTGQTWFSASATRLALDCFLIDHARPSWLLNRWISGMLQLFKPQIAALLEERDEAIKRHDEADGDSYVYEDTGLEVTSQRRISVTRQIVDVERALSRARRRHTITRVPLPGADTPSMR